MPKIIFRPAPTPPPFVPPGPANKFLTFTAKENGCRIGYSYYSEYYEVQDIGLNIEYSLNGGQSWLPYTMGTDESAPQMIELNNGEFVMFRGNNVNLAYYLDSANDYQTTKFVIEGQMEASGDVTALLNGIGGNVSIPLYCFATMFEDCTSLTKAPVLPSTTLAEFCYAHMFSGCTSLTKAPVLPATTLAESCYANMFSECASLTQTPSLPATTLAINCYNYMFHGCTSLTKAPVLPATTLAEYCYDSMFAGCTSLTQAPSMPATTLVSNCYSSMFNGCISLNHVECLATNISANNSTNSWLSNVALAGTFVKSASMSSWPSGASGIPSGWSVQDKS